jgi:hypothetical protein
MWSNVAMAVDSLTATTRIQPPVFAAAGRGRVKTEAIRAA